MSSLLSRFLIIAICSCCLFEKEITLQSVWTLLGCVSISALNFYKTEFVPFKLLCILYLCFGFFFPQVLIFLPVFIFEIPSLMKMMKEDRYIPKVISILLFAQFAVLYYFLCRKFSIFTVLIVTFLMVLSLLLRIITDINTVQTEQLHTILDESTLQTQELKKRNKELMDKQDYEINVATLQERNRIAREIHDNVGHLLTRSILQVAALKAISTDYETKENLGTIGKTLDTAMTTIRKSVHDLHDESIDLKSAVEEMIPNFPSLTISFAYDIDSPMNRNIKYTFIAIIKEALNNTVKHSNAGKSNIIIREHPAFYQLFIEDNGKNTKPDFSNGIGLQTMQERVDALDGTLRINVEDGFHIFITIPRKKENAE